MIDWDAITAIATLCGLVVGSVSAYIALKEQKDNHEWNRKKTSEETLRELVDGGFTNLLDDIQAGFDWHIIGDGREYREVVKSMESLRKIDLDKKLRRVLRILEVLAIHIKHEIIIEDVCYDYLASIGPEIYEKTKGFVDDERERRDEQRVFREFQLLMARWTDKNGSHQGTKPTVV